MGQREVCWRVSEEAYLDDEGEDWILGVVSGGIRTLEDASLIGRSDCHGDSRLGQ